MSECTVCVHVQNQNLLCDLTCCCSSNIKLGSVKRVFISVFEGVRVRAQVSS